MLEWTIKLPTRSCTVKAVRKLHVVKICFASCVLKVAFPTSRIARFLRVAVLSTPHHHLYIECGKLTRQDMRDSASDSVLQLSFTTYAFWATVDPACCAKHLRHQDDGGGYTGTVCTVRAVLSIEHMSRSFTSRISRSLVDTGLANSPEPQHGMTN